MRSLVRVAAMLAVLMTLSSCLNPAVSPGERLARACDYYADALESPSQKDALLHLRDAAHWAELAAEKDASIEALETAYGHIEDELDTGDDVRPTSEVLAASRRAAAQSCDEHATPGVARRIREATADAR